MPIGRRIPLKMMLSLMLVACESEIATFEDQGCEPADVWFEVTSPQKGIEWASNSEHWVTWRSIPGRATDDILATVEVSFDGNTWVPIEANDGALATNLRPLVGELGSRFLWRVPGTATSDNVRLRVRDANEVMDPEGCTTATTAGPFSVTPSQEATYVWEFITKSPGFEPRDGAGALVLDDAMWLIGGWNAYDPINFPRITTSEIWRSTDGARWDLVIKAPWEPRHTAGHVIHDNRMWVIGGDLNQRAYQKDVWSSHDGINWTAATNDAPWGNRVLHYTVSYAGKIWVMGGQTLPQLSAEAPAKFYNDVWSSEDGATWERVTESAPWAPRGMISGGVVFKGRLWLLGGGTYETPQRPYRDFYNDVWSTTDGQDWTRHVEFAPWPARQYHSVAVFDDRMWVMFGAEAAEDNVGGYNSSAVWYSSDGVNWYRNEVSGPYKRHATSIFVYRNSLWVVAGDNSLSQYWEGGPDVWRLDVLPSVVPHVSTAR
jgi:hypothetical protein